MNITPVASKTIIGIHCRNPLNVKQSPTGPWLGQIGRDDSGHAQMSDWVFGWRIAIHTLQKKWAAGKTSLIAITSSWAPLDDPGAGNNPIQYCAAVRGFMLLDRGIAGYDGINAVFGDTLRYNDGLELRPLFLRDGKVGSEPLLLAVLRAMAQVEIYAGFERPLEELRSAVALYNAIGTGAIKS